MRRWLSPLGQRRVSPATIIIVVVGALFLFNFVNQVIRQAQLEQMLETIHANGEKLKAENRDLRRQVLFYESNDYAEQVAREQLGYARLGDTVILPTYPDRVVTDTAILGKTATVSDTVVVTPVPEPNWMRWWRMLRGNP